ncbi:unnamed protein product [Rotaria magnacalcarata]|uniref:Ig-like domain-containing protein n=1 Tax=Rotaria magnacalcarata TaxID=392030 RepID=A0A816BU56_9BILA|nr:unnamed protein product [Rotaria magnacalcarata]
MLNIPANAEWAQQGVTVAGDHGDGNDDNQLSFPIGLFVDDDQTVVIADTWNHRIIQWKKDAKSGQVVAGGKRLGSELNLLYCPTDVLIDKETDSLIICDHGNNRVVRWSRRSDTTQEDILVDNINCHGLAMDDQRYLYISNHVKNEVRRYRIGDQNDTLVAGTLVAGGDGLGNDLNKLDKPTYIFVDRQQTVYVSDSGNKRVMKWTKGAEKGIVVAGYQCIKTDVPQLENPCGLFVDTLGALYVVDSYMNRVMRWPKGATQGTVIVNGYYANGREYKLNKPMGLSFDRHGNLYVVDRNNFRVQRFSLYVQPKVEAPEPVNDQSCVIGQDTQISLEVSEIRKPQVPWYFNNKPLPTNDRFEVAHTEDGTSTLSIRQAEFGDKGVYTARATNAVGEAKAKTTLDIAGIKPTINTNLDATLYATNGETMILKITASGTPKPDIVWIRGNDEIILTDRIKVAKPTGDDDAYTLKSPLWVWVRVFCNLQ